MLRKQCPCLTERQAKLSNKSNETKKTKVILAIPVVSRHKHSHFLIVMFIVVVKTVNVNYYLSVANCE